MIDDHMRMMVKGHRIVEEIEEIWDGGKFGSVPPTWLKKGGGSNFSRQRPRPLLSDCILDGRPGQGARLQVWHIPTDSGQHQRRHR